MRRRHLSPLSQLASDLGSPVPCAANVPLDLSDPDSVWFVEKGAVNLFFIESENEIVNAAPQFMLHAEAGRLLFSVVPSTDSSTISLNAKGCQDTVLRQLSWAEIGHVDTADLILQVNLWVSEISSVLARFDAPNQQTSQVLLHEPGQLSVENGSVISSQRGTFWVSVPSPESVLYMGLVNPPAGHHDGPPMIPLVRKTWMNLTESQNLSIHPTEEILNRGLLNSSLIHFHEMGLNLERLNRYLQVGDQVNLARERVLNHQTDEDATRLRLFDLYDLTAGEGFHSRRTLFEQALTVIGEHAGIDFLFPQRGDSDNVSQLLTHILDSSGVRARQVRISPVEKWWTTATGALLAFRKDSGEPVALIPNWFGSYYEIQPQVGKKTRITKKSAQSLRSEAWLFYQPLPNRSADLGDLLRVALRGLGMDFVRLALAGFLAGSMMLFPALMLGYGVDDVIPDKGVSDLYLAGGVLVLAACLVALLNILQKMALLRIEGQSIARAEAAYWDRLQRLPRTFMRGYSACDLAARGLTFQSLRSAMEVLLIHGAFSLVFLLPAFAVALFYDWLLGVAVIAITLISLAAYTFIGMHQLTFNFRIAEATHALADRLFQLINGISILRLEGAEGSAYAIWARVYRKRQSAELRQGAVRAHGQALSIAMLPLTAALLFLIAMNSESWPGSAGDFLVVYVVFTVYLESLVRLGQSVTTLSQLVPEIHKIRPFLEKEPEVGARGEPVEVLSGNICLDRISFKYDPDGPLILDGVSIDVEPGEFIAITGKSGSGKSTLFKLMLGLEEPSSGAVYYDGRDLRHLNRNQVRRMLAVIPQSVELIPDDVWDNIAGWRQDTSESDVWRAARLANVDREVKSMPMKLFTGIGAMVAAGGESQRLTIARALNSNARIFLLDEATNWLDNESQARVMDNLVRMDATKIVIAHRLSTLTQADRIYVLQDGRVVEVGNYADLIDRDGHFRGLVQRQIV